MRSGGQGEAGIRGERKESETMNYSQIRVVDRDGKVDSIEPVPREACVLAITGQDDEKPGRPFFGAFLGLRGFRVKFKVPFS